MFKRRNIFAAAAMSLIFMAGCKYEVSSGPPPVVTDEEDGTDEGSGTDEEGAAAAEWESPQPPEGEASEEELKTALMTLLDNAAADTLEFADVENFFRICYLTPDMWEYWTFDEAWVDLNEECLASYLANALALLDAPKTSVWSFKNYGTYNVGDASLEMYRALAGASLLADYKNSAQPLSDGIFTGDAIEKAGQSRWYKFTAEESLSYEVLWADSKTNASLFSPTPTCNVNVSAYKEDGSLIFLRFEAGDQPFLCKDGAAKPETVQETGGSVYLRVSALSSVSTGTYAVKFTAK